MKFGENLKLIRRSNNISQEDLADKLGVSRQSVSKWETGENYPSMQNIMCLCSIFKCKINELVHEDFVDIHFLDEEIKMSVVKFKENEQKKMKGLSKFIYVISRIFKIINICGIALSVIGLIMSLYIVPKVDIKDDYTVKVMDKEGTYSIENGELKLDFGEDDKITIDINRGDKEKVVNFFKESNIYKISFVTTLFVSLGLTCFFLFKVLSYIEKLFKNIHDKDTPFSLDNVNNIKKIALYLALVVATPDVLGTLASLLFKLELNVEISLINYLFVIIVIAIAYIFKYGYEIQLDSKGKIYGNSEE